MPSAKHSSPIAVRTGCCGFPVAHQKYYETFQAVEIQQTFYQLPRIETAAKWRREAPGDFEFSLKAWQLITHEAASPTYRRLELELPEAKARRYGSFKLTLEVMEAWEQTRRFARELGAVLIVFQCPASFSPIRRNKENMTRFFKALDRKGLTLIWEPRGQWSREEVRELCEDLDLVHCLDPLKGAPVWGQLCYYRLHGPRGYASRYEVNDLRQLLAMCHGETYCFFNNRFMLDDALAFRRLARSRKG
jgi:uncharacterized protein YecE (DUF72 family)